MSGDGQQGTMRSLPLGTRDTMIFLLVSLGLGAALLAAAIAAFFLSADRYAESTLQGWSGSALLLVAGAGERAGEDLRIESLGTENRAFVLLPVRTSDAAGISRLRVHVSGLNPDETRISLAWRASGDPPRVHRVPLALANGPNTIDLAGFEGWAGEIRNLMVLLEGGLSQPLSIKRLELLPALPTPAALFRTIWREWTEFEGWRAHSINFIVGGARSPLVSPVLATALWVAFSAAIYLVLSLSRKAPVRALPLVMIVLAGWIALDARWQWDLVRQVQSTHAEFAGADSRDKRHSAIDRSLYELAETVKANHAVPGTRVWIFSDRPSTNPYYYLRVRLHYHLLPLNTASVWDVPPARGTAPGDLIIVLTNHTRLTYEMERGTLHWGRARTIPVELLLSHRLANVYRTL